MTFQTKRRPKLYWRDSGLLHALGRVSDRGDLIARPWVGASWEGFVIEQVLGELSARGQPFSAYYFRTSDGYEADLVLELGDEVWAIEVKLTAHPAPEMLGRLKKTGELMGADRVFLVTQTPRAAGSDREGSVNLAGLLEMQQ